MGSDNRFDRVLGDSGCVVQFTSEVNFTHPNSRICWYCVECLHHLLNRDMAGLDLQDRTSRNRNHFWYPTSCAPSCPHDAAA